MAAARRAVARASYVADWTEAADSSNRSAPIFPRASHGARVPRSDGHLRDRLRDDGTRPNHARFTHCDTGENQDPHAKPNVRTDRHLFRGDALVLHRPLRIRPGMGIGENDRLEPDQGTRTEGKSTTGIKQHAVRNGDIVINYQSISTKHLYPLADTHTVPDRCSQTSHRGHP